MHKRLSDRFSPEVLREAVSGRLEIDEEKMEARIFQYLDWREANYGEQERRARRQVVIMDELRRLGFAILFGSEGPF